MKNEENGSEEQILLIMNMQNTSLSFGGYCNIARTHGCSQEDIHDAMEYA